MRRTSAVSSPFGMRPRLIYVNGTSQPDGTACVLYLLYMRLSPLMNEPVKVPDVFFTLILSTCQLY